MRPKAGGATGLCVEPCPMILLHTSHNVLLQDESFCRASRHILIYRYWMLLFADWRANRQAFRKWQGWPERTINTSHRAKKRTPEKKKTEGSARVCITTGFPLYMGEKVLAHSTPFIPVSLWMAPFWVCHLWLHPRYNQLPLPSPRHLFLCHWYPVGKSCTTANKNRWCQTKTLFDRRENQYLGLF